jgi:DNA gyrase/topoisomerase IV subunit A
VQKSRLIEKIAELLNEKKLPLVADVATNRPRTSAS